MTVQAENIAFDAAVRATAEITGIRRAIIIGREKGETTDAERGRARRLAMYVGHRWMGVSIADIVRAFARIGVSELSASVAIDAVAAEIAADGPARAVVPDIATLALDMRREMEGGASVVQSPLTAEQTAEAQRLAARGWSVTGLARRYGVRAEQIAPLVGRSWGASA